MAFEHRTANVFQLRWLGYGGLHARFGLPSQMVQLAIKAARVAYCRGKSIRPEFRKHAAVSYDVRTTSFKGIDRVSLLTLSGRVLAPMIVGAYQAERMRLPEGQGKLVLRESSLAPIAPPRLS